MLDLPRIERIQLSEAPLGQRIVALALLAPNYLLPPQVEIHLEGRQNLPSEPVIIAMNHTDRYNYWPFQYQLWRQEDRFTATWVKGKYYENEILGRFMEMTNNIPTVSRGYIIARDFYSALGRSPEQVEYRALRDLVDQVALDPGCAEERSAEVRAQAYIPEAIFDQPRDMLGRSFAPSRERYPEAINALFTRMMRRFTELNREAFEKGNDVIIFPQGTRSIRLSRGHIGIAEMALYLDRPILPVGCNGCDKVYPGDYPLARGGQVTYRIGELIRRDELDAWRPEAPFEPFNARDENTHRESFQGLVDHVMDRINDLLDPEYQYSQDMASDGVQEGRRFL